MGLLVPFRMALHCDLPGHRQQSSSVNVLSLSVFVMATHVDHVPHEMQLYSVWAIDANTD